MTDNPWAPPPPPWSQPAPPTWTPSPAPPPPGRFKIPWVAVLSCVIVAVLVAGIVAVVDRHHGSNSSQLLTPSGPSVGGSSPTTIPGPPVSSKDANALESLVVTQGDIGSVDQVGIISGGDQVVGEPTLDLCNGSYPSETRRVARLQVATAQTNFSTEAVLYDNAGGTAQAFTELRSVAAKCPAAPVQSPVGEQTVTTHFNAAPDASWATTAGVERLAFDITVTDPQGNTVRSIAVYLRRGRALLGVYFPTASGAPLSVAGKNSLAGIVSVFEGRMAKLSKSIVNGHETPVGNPGAV